MIEKFLRDEQDPKATEKVYSRLNDLLTTGEEIIYIAVQKKPLVNLLPDCVAITNKRVLFFTPGNFGLTLKFVDFVWKDIIDVHTKEELIGAVFSVNTANGAEMGVDYLPKVQARRLYQYAQERKEEERETRRLRELEEKRAESGSMQFETPVVPSFQPAPPVQPVPASVQPPPAPVYEQPAPVIAPPPFIPPAPVVHEEPKPDELTEKLKKLRMLFDKGLISQEEYNHKKLELLSDL